MKLHRAFEFGIFQNFDRETLEPYLKEVWQQRFFEQERYSDDEMETQGIIRFDGNIAKAKNYVGFIQTEKDQIEIYPKVFKNHHLDSNNILLYQRHLFFWFDYCKKWKFPFSKINLKTFTHTDLPELIISLIARRFCDVISQSPILLYEEFEEGLQMPKGRINIPRYITTGLSNGNHHVIECDLEPLQYDNRLNRIIKYVSRLLHLKAKFRETRQLINDVIFLLDDVEDVICTSRQLDTIRINSFFYDYNEIIDLCRLVLDQQLYSDQYYEHRQWSLLFPMEYVFEDFIAGFIESKFSPKWKVEYQKSDMYLTDERIFQMKHDILLTSKATGQIILVDTKYKIRDRANHDKKKGIIQSDLYQMTSYAFRRGCNAVLLLYPNCSEEVQKDITINISSGFSTNDKIKVVAAEVPFWSMDKFPSVSEKLTEKLDDLLVSVFQNR
jgi:5-methylcytosine-specific restriction enzyme subunit McrC